MVHAEGIIRTADITLVGLENLFSTDEINRVNDLIVHNSLNRLVKRVPGLRALFTTNAEGDLRHDSFRYPVRNINLRNRAYITQGLSLDQNALYISKPIKNPFFGFDSLPLSRPIYSMEGYIKGVAVAIMTPDTLLQRDNICKKCVVSLYKNNGEKVVSFPANVVAQPDILSFKQQVPPNQVTSININKLATKSIWVQSQDYDLTLLYSYFE
jgi:hypothetical protein